MAETPQKNLVTRLADVGEEAIQRLGGAPGGDRLVGAVNTLRNRTDEMQKKLRGLDDVHERLGSIEQRLDKLEGKPSPAKSSPATPRAKKSPDPSAGSS